MTISLDAIAEAMQAQGLLVDRRGRLPKTVTLVTDDSRRVQPGALFVAVRGADRDGHAYLGAAEKAGAAAAIVEDAHATSIPALVVSSSRRAAAIAGAVAADWPARDLQLVGVTGTNGKTTTVNILRHLLDEPKARAASIGTLGVLIGSEGEVHPGGSGLTTPGPIELQQLFKGLRDSGVARVAMEVSSHALHQHRVDGLEFDVAVFTNLTRDHLDYHGSMQAYFESKARLLDYLRPHGAAVVNLDDQAWNALPGERRRVTFSERVQTAEVHAIDIRFTPRGSHWTLSLGGERHEVNLPLIGDFNIPNALGAAAAAWALGLNGQRIADALSRAPQVPGRLEVISEAPAVLRDYAHTPDALDRALDAVRPFTKGRLIAVFGCGGDRDKGKRPEMGGIAARKSDLAIVTSDNPRTEDPEKILDDIESGMGGVAHERIEDRRAAIARAMDLWSEGDVILLAGKGHEDYQIRGTTKLPFDEKQIVQELRDGDEGGGVTARGER
jgi:UDP-N-acetylmuramoyl-L-alanyl-D-glutamate--2,6-diaminopimelate ligase